VNLARVTHQEYSSFCFGHVRSVFPLGIPVKESFANSLTGQGPAKARLTPPVPRVNVRNRQWKGRFLMRRILLYLAIVMVMVGCGKTHPVKLEMDPAMEDGSVEKIAVFAFASALHQTADPDRVAPRTFDQLFRQALDAREDYQWVAPSSVEYVLESEDMVDDAEVFIDNWRQKRQADAAFLKRLGTELQVDGVLIGVVETWQQDEVDVRETATPTTYVGATVTIFDVNDGKVLFEASDEDFLEGARSENRDQQIVRSGAGQIYSDPGGSAYQAPPPEEVAVKVVAALVRSIPLR
jgi:hypothetical protein